MPECPIDPQHPEQEELMEVSEELLEAQRQALLEEHRRRELLGDAAEEQRQNFRDYDRSQIQFVPLRLDNFLEADHPARVVDVVVERMDLGGLYAVYSDEGNPAFHPRMMLKVLFYAYYKGLFSSRKIWDALEYRADFMFLSAGQLPNFRTVNSFRLRHLAQLPELFSQIVFMCGELGMVGFENLLVDGQKIQANANFRKSKNLKGLQEEYRKVNAGIAKLLEKEVGEDFPVELRDKRVERLEEKAKQLEEFQKKLEALGDEEKRLNMSDEDAPVMKHKNGRSLPSYTHQSATDTKCGVVCAVQTTRNSDRPEDLLPLVDQAKENSGEAHRNVVADSGFCSYEVLQQVEEQREEEFYLPDRDFEASKNPDTSKGRYSQERFEREQDGTIRCPQGHPMAYKRTVSYEDGHEVYVYEGRACEGCAVRARCTKGKKRTLNIDSRDPHRQAMRKRLRSDIGREIYMKRQGLAEAIHGDDQKNKGWTQHHLRGLMKAGGEFLLIRIATNLGKIIRYRSSEVLAMACP